jgi:hypothetical protein
MANQSHSGIIGDPWLRCQRCGVDTRQSRLVPQKGLLVCIDNGCVDDLLIEQRPTIIEQVLSSGPDAPPAEVLQEPTYEEVSDYTI